MADKYKAWSDADQLDIEVEATDTSAGAGNAGDIVALDAGGLIDPSMLPGSDVVIMTAGENLSAGDFVYVDSAGEVLKADASVTNKRALGYVKNAILAAATGNVYFEGTNSALAGLTIGDEYFLSDSTPGGVTNTAPTASGSIIQTLGFARSATEIIFEHGNRPLKRA